MVQSSQIAPGEPALLTGHLGSAQHIRHEHTSLKKTACPTRLPKQHVRLLAGIAHALPQLKLEIKLDYEHEHRTRLSRPPLLRLLVTALKTTPATQNKDSLRPELRPESGPAEQAGSELHNKACWRPMPAPHITKKASRYRVSTRHTMARRRQYTGHGHPVQQGSSG